MSAPHIILSSLPSLCQKLVKLVKFDEVVTTTILHGFLDMVYVYVEGFLAKVIVCGQEFTSSQVRTKKVDAEQDAAKLAFESLQQQEQQQQQHNTDTGMSAASHRVISSSSSDVNKTFFNTKTLIYFGDKTRTKTSLQCQMISQINKLHVLS